MTAKALNGNASFQKQFPTEDPEVCTDRLLEWDELCSHVCRFASTSAGKKACRQLKRGRHVVEAMMLQEETKAIEILSSQMKVEFNFGRLSTERVSSALERATRGGMLSGEQLGSIAILLDVSQGLQRSITAPFRKKETFKDEREMVEMVFRPWSELEIDVELMDLITFAIDEEGILKDSASQDLSRARSEYRRIRKRLEETFRSFKGEMVERSGRMCLALPPGSTVPSNALVLDSGSSGNVYCEPRSALPLNNDLSMAFVEMRNAEEKVLWNLTSQVSERSERLNDLFQHAVHLDIAIARCRYTQWIDGAFPQFSFVDDGPEGFHIEKASLFLSLINLRHPLLLGQALIYAEANARRQRKDSFRLAPPIPNDVIFNAETKALVITGPNAGGKTATLKALGLCALMAKAGLGLPAKQPVWIPFYSSVLADIGDEQSLTSSLSTFSGHLHRIQNLRSVADGKCLVLLDELGTGTDPKEGAALGLSFFPSKCLILPSGAALLKALVKGGKGGALTTVVSTHHGLLKNLAYEYQIEKEDGKTYSEFENASMEFDDEECAPTYRLIMGVPGQSNALNIASRLGMDCRIIGAARNRLGRQHISENALISQIQNEQEKIDKIINSMEKIEKKTESVKMDIQETKRRVDLVKYQISTQEADDYTHALERGREALARLKLKKKREAEQVMVEQDDSEWIRPIADPPPTAPSRSKENTTWIPEVGEMVYVPDIGREATLIELTSNNKAIIRAGAFTITVESANLQPL